MGIWRRFALQWRSFLMLNYIASRMRNSGRALLIPGITCGKIGPQYAHDFAFILDESEAAAGWKMVGIGDANGQMCWLVVAHNVAAAWHHSNRIARGFLDVNRQGYTPIADIPEFLKEYESARVHMSEVHGVQLEPFNIAGEAYAFGKEGD